MESFLDYLPTAFSRNFVQGQYNDVVWGLYKVLIGAIRFDADQLTITDTHVILSKGNEQIRSVDISAAEAMGTQLEPKVKNRWMSHRTALQVILKYDARVQQHLVLIEEKPESISYRILPDKSGDNEGEE